MPATLDANLGTKAQAASATCSLVTSAAAAPGSLIVVGVGYFNNVGGTASVTTTGGLTWANATPTVSGSLHGYIFYAYASAGLASGTTLTWTMSTGVGDWLIGAASFLGMDPTPTLLASNGVAATSTAWSSGSIAAGEVNLGIVMAFEDGDGAATSTTTAPATELIDFNNAGQSEAFTFSYDLASAATATLAGTWSASLTHVARGAAFKIAPGMDNKVQRSPLLMKLRRFARVPLIAFPQPILPVGIVLDTIDLGDIASAEVVPDLFQSSIGLQGIASSEALSAIKLLDQITLGGIASLEAFTALSLKDLITLVGIASGENVPALLMPDQVILGDIASAENVPAVTLGGTDLISLGGIPTGEAFTALNLKDIINLTSIASGEALSALKLTDQLALAGIVTAENVAALFQSALTLQGIPSAENVPGLTLTDPNAGAGVSTKLPMTGVGP